MDSSNTHNPAPGSSLARVLVVADWSVDAEAVIEACERRNREAPAAFALVVPAWLHGIDWAGDPRASVPCAHRQLANVTARAAAAGRTFDAADVGDPEPVAATCDALADWPADEILICARGSRVPHLFDLTHRVERVSGLPVQRVSLPVPSSSNGTRRSWLRQRNGHCALDQPQAA
ncbi:MAG: hypothetical protein M3340_00485 [Actinomycetota bacterium]|nr:hypothetical protein [Actinomycetota bacterium]